MLFLSLPVYKSIFFAVDEEDHGEEGDDEVEEADFAIRVKEAQGCAKGGGDTANE